jgi:rubrerythrin
MKLIDADKILEVYKDEWEGQVILDAIANAPEVEARPIVHGEWNFNRGAACGEKSYFCSVCADGESDYGTDDFCPKCGAVMKKEN